MTPDPQILARAVCRRLRDAGHAAFFVGGAVRNRLLGVPVREIDVATDASPDDVAGLFSNVVFVGAAFGVCLVREDDAVVEVATFRKEGPYLDRRHPSFVERGTLDEDAARRDFTINGLYEDPDTGEILDLVNGRADIDARLVRCIGDPARRFGEDALRLLRALRFATEYDMDIEAQTWTALRHAAPTILDISAERVRDELTRLLVLPAAPRALELLRDSRLLHHLLPEVEAMIGVEQDREWHPEGDVWVHTLLAVRQVEPRTAVNVWATLLHDVGKPVTATVAPDGTRRFYGHDKEGARIADAICTRLKFPNREREAIVDAVARHMRFMEVANWRASTMRRFIAHPTIDVDLAVHRADCLAAHGNLSAWEAVSEAVENRRAEVAAGPPPEPFLTGEDLKALGLPPGPAYKTILKTIEDARVDGLVGSREEALEWARRLAEKSESG